MAWLRGFDVVPVFALPYAEWEVNFADMSGVAVGHVTPRGSASTRHTTTSMERTVIAFLKHCQHLLTQRSLAIGHSLSSTYQILQSTLPVASDEPVNIMILLSSDDLTTD